MATLHSALTTALALVLTLGAAASLFLTLPLAQYTVAVHALHWVPLNGAVRAAAVEAFGIYAAPTLAVALHLFVVAPSVTATMLVAPHLFPWSYARFQALAQGFTLRGLDVPSEPEIALTLSITSSFLSCAVVLLWWTARGGGSCVVDGVCSPLPLAGVPMCATLMLAWPLLAWMTPPIAMGAHGRVRDRAARRRERRAAKAAVKMAGSGRKGSLMGLVLRRRNVAELED